ncbi:MAG: hypothetical protein FJ388_18715 [Verrucomicrobia bacterium]|nr:hypothetical protein [Verrucomicrobiota bacterium]
MQPGDTVRIRAGEYFVGPTWIVNRAGTAARPITYKAYGDGEARITAASVLPTDKWKHVKGAIYCAEVSQPVMVVFQNTYPLHMPGERANIFSVDDLMPNSFYATNKTVYVWLEDGSDPKNSVMRAASGHVVSLYGCDHTVFDGLTVEYGFNGIKNQRETTHHITIRNCTIRSIASQGIQPVARDCVIEKNLFQKIGSNKWQHGIYGSRPGTIIRGNVFEEMAGAGIHQFHQGDPPAGGGCEFSGNVFRKPRKMTTRPGPVVRNPYYVDIVAWGEGGNRIFNNIFYGEGKRGGISLNSVNNRVWHNTFVGSACAIEFYARKSGNQVLNNIFQDATRSFLFWPTNALPQTLDYNLYHNASAPPHWQRDGKVFKTFGDYQQAAGETHSRYDDPRLTSATDARVRPGSPAVDGGATLRDVPADFDGVARPQGSASDIGAFETKTKKE